MAYSASRLTLYALLSSMEEDLRHMVVQNLDGQLSPHEVFPGDVLEKCFERMERDIGGRVDDASLVDLMPYSDFGDTLQILNIHKNLLSPQNHELLKTHTQKLEKLIPIRNRVAHSRPLDFDDLVISLEIGRDVVKTYPASWPSLKETLNKLDDDPSFVLGLEIPPLYKDESAEKHNLPIPDFDETGFVGRSEQIKQLVSLCFGAYPVVTIVGEGGVGKTAIALKVAYELLDLENCPFDAIVWASSKTTQITANDIVEIDGAIRDSLGIFRVVANQLAGMTDSDVLDEILAYLKEFRILLILDNLETVLDDRLKGFLGRLPSGSKVLITSRIGIGAYEYPVKLEALNQAESIQLMRTLAGVRGVKDLVKMPNPQLARYCTKLQNNPGFIKWFVSAVQIGKRPEEVFAKPDLFLDFCMSNVYDYLSQDSRRTLMAMQCLPGKHSQAELAFLLEIDDVLVLQRSIQQLLTTNMVRMHCVPVGTSFESRYELSELARSYLTKHHPIQINDAKFFNKRKQQIKAASDLIKTDQVTNRYNVNFLKMRSASDAIIAKYLSDALKQTRRGYYQDALKFVAKAKQLAPEYFEVHRVEGFVKAFTGDVTGAQSAYDAAVELEPDWPPLRLLYGGFLMRSFDDFDGAIMHFQSGLKHDPTSYDLQVEMARAHLYLKKYKEADELIFKLTENKNLSVWQQKKVYDLRLQSLYRRAEQLLNEHDPEGSLKLMEELKRLYEVCPRHIHDDQMTDHVAKSAHTAVKLCQTWKVGTDLFNRARAVARWLIKITGTLGYVVAVPADPNSMATIELLDKSHFDVPRKMFVFSDEFNHLEEGQRAFFHLYKRGHITRIINVILVSQ